MATSGTITAYATEHSNIGRKLKFSWTAESANSSGTLISWKLVSTGGSSSYYSVGPTKLTIEGTSVYSSSRHSMYEKTLDSGTKRIAFNSDGTATLNATLRTAIYEAKETSFTDSWTLPGRYKVSFSANGGSGAPGYQYKYYGVALTLTTTKPTRTGYTFSHWDTASDGTGTNYSAGGSYKTNASDTLYAIWTRTGYKITLDKQSGSGGTSAYWYKYGVGTYYANSDYTGSLGSSLTIPTRTGYKFGGYFTGTGGSGTQYVSASGAFINSICNNAYGDTLYAYWIPYALTINYYSNGATDVYVDGKSVATTGEIYSGAVKYGVTYSDAIYNFSAQGSTLYFVKTGYHPAADSEGYYYYVTADGAYSIRQSPGSMTGQAVATKLGKSITSENASVNIYAKWAVNTGTIYFYAAGQADNGKTVTGKTYGSYTISNGKSSRTQSFTYNSTAFDVGNVGTTFTAPTGYTLQEKWRVGSASSITIMDPTVDQDLSSYAVNSTGVALNLYPYWKANTYTVTYDGNGATAGSTASSSHTYDIEKALTTNGFTKSGYTFAGWNTSANGNGTSYANKASVVNLVSTNGGAIKLYAQWTPLSGSYTIKYDGNGATGGSTTSSTHNFGTAKALTANGFTKTGYTFKNWNTAISGNGTSYANKASVTNLTTTKNATVVLYAQWTANTTSVTFNVNGGTSSNFTKTLKYDSGNNADLSTSLPTHASKIFNGWNTKADGTGIKVYMDTGLKANDGTYWNNGVWKYASSSLTLYAHWVTAEEYYKIWLYNSGYVAAKEFIESQYAGTYVFAPGAIVTSPQFIEQNVKDSGGFTYVLGKNSMTVGLLDEY